MTVSVAPGDVIDGTYVIERMLGAGGMGAVFIAKEERLGRRVAIKVLLDAVAKDASAVTRFEREARSAAALQSDHVTRVLSVGRLASGGPYIVMELLEGEDLSSILAKHGAIAAHDVIAFMTPVCEALVEAHALGIVHRDLKPANVFLSRRNVGGPRVKVLDFGISKAPITTAAPSLTSTTALMGTPLYMSPEQLREAKNVDNRGDIWAIGVMIYELATGRTPWISDSLTELCVFIMTTPHVPLRTLRPDIPPALDAIVDRCLQKKPDDRYANIQQLMAALAAVPRASQPAAPATPPQRQATPRMNASPLAGLPTEAVAARGRAQAPTEAARPGAYPVPPPPGPQPPIGRPVLGLPLATFPTNLGNLGSVPGQGGSGAAGSAPALPVSAATVDPVSTTQPWLPAKRPPVIGIGLVFVAALAIGGIGFYAIVGRQAPEGDAPSLASSSSSGVRDPSVGAALVAAPAEAPSARPSAAPAAPTVAPPNAAAKAQPTALALPPPVAVPPPGPTIATPLAAPAPVITPTPTPVATATPVTPSTPSAHVAPSAKPPLPPSNPGSLMPAARN